jgi:phosphoglycerate dehydrogenase-like enzyme
MQSVPERLSVALAMNPRLTPDLLSEEDWTRLAASASILDRRPIERFDEPRARDLLHEADVLLTGWGCSRIDEGVLAQSPRLKLVAHTGSSIRPIVSDALWIRGITVTSSAAANAIPVAEFALATILLANKGVFAAREHYRANREPLHYPWVAPGEKGNLGAVVGIVGASRTGRHLLRLLSAFNLTVLVYDPIADAKEIEALGAHLVSLDNLIAAADVLSIHAPSLPQTKGMIGADQLSRLRNGATLINTARGDLVDQRALEQELSSGRIFAVLDVTDPEPLPQSSPLFDLPNAFVTPHVAGAAGWETRRLAQLAIDDVERFGRAEPLRHAVSPEMLATIG